MAKLLVGLTIMLIFSSVNCYWWDVSGDVVLPSTPTDGDPIMEPTFQVVTVMPDNPNRVYHVIEQADVLIMESFPPQLSLMVTGYQPDGCIEPVIVDKVIEDTTITVSIYRKMPVDAICPAVLITYEENIALGSFEMGKTYTVIVNGYEVTVKL
jgi:hypothetical protein